ncbi:MAG TPA: D-aminoacylase [bacterium]|nr:D-aminoacylase [bacterium]
MARLHDVIIRNARIVDGTGSLPAAGDIAMDGDQIARVGSVLGGSGRVELDADGLVVAPGFINMLSWANVSLLADGRSMGDIKQGVTLEVMGEGSSMGPLNDRMKRELVEHQGDIKYDVAWTTLREYLDHLVRRGVSTNVASFIGSATPRVHELGYEDRLPSAAELDRMRRLVAQAMQEGAVGISSALIYPPASFSDTNELIALAEVAAEYGGMYISHIRNEEATVLAALEEFFEIVRSTGITGEIYHLKVSGKANWAKFDPMIARIEHARSSELPVTADMYPYIASSTGLDTGIPDWAHAGGQEALETRLRDPAARGRIKEEFALFTTPENIIVVSVKQDVFKPLIGRTLAEIAADRVQDFRDTVMDLIAQDHSRIGAVFFTMSEDNVRKAVALPWVSFGSDAGSMAAEGVFLKSGTHPRAYGTFARVLGKYVREERVISLEEAIRRMTSFPAQNLKLQRRGRLAEGYYADVVVLDPSTIRDTATFQQPHQYAVGVHHVFVNGVHVLKDGEHTGAKPGRVVLGPGVDAKGSS